MRKEVNLYCRSNTVAEGLAFKSIRNLFNEFLIETQDTFIYFSILEITCFLFTLVKCSFDVANAEGVNKGNEGIFQGTLLPSEYYDTSQFDEVYLTFAYLTSDAPKFDSFCMK